MSTLSALIQQAYDFDCEDVICAMRPWGAGCAAKIVRLDADYRVPPDVQAEGYEYFLEIDVVRQVLDEFRDRPAATWEQKCIRVIEYAARDA